MSLFAASNGREKTNREKEDRRSADADASAGAGAGAGVEKDKRQKTKTVAKAKANKDWGYQQCLLEQHMRSNTFVVYYNFL